LYTPCTRLYGSQEIGENGDNGNFGRDKLDEEADGWRRQVAA